MTTVAASTAPALVTVTLYTFPISIRIDRGWKSSTSRSASMMPEQIFATLAPAKCFGKSPPCGQAPMARVPAADWPSTSIRGTVVLNHGLKAPALQDSSTPKAKRFQMHRHDPATLVFGGTVMYYANYSTETPS